MSTIQIFLLGRFETVCGEKVLRARDWPRRKAAALLQRLALSRRLLRDEAIDFLWPDADSASGANNLYRTLHALRQTLDTALGPGTAEAAFAFTDGALTLTDSVWVDAHEFEKQAQAALINPQSPISHLESAIELYTGDLLPDDVYADWLAAPRESLRRLQREAQLKLAVHNRDAGDYASALALLTPLVVRDRADEVVHRELMRTYALAGRRHDALRQYQACVDALAVELDVPPEPETAALYSQILSGDIAPPSLISSSQSLQSLNAETEEQATPLVGRESELESLRLWLRTAWRGQGKVILITGDSGVGKTRLALEARRVAASAGMTTLFGAAYEQEGQLPYQPFVEAFDDFLSQSPRLPDGVEPSNPITHFKRLGVSDPQQEGWAQFKAVADLLGALSQPAPVVLLLDDLHAADEASLRLLHYLARHARTAPVVLMATCRTDVSLSSSFGTLINALYRERLSESLTLAPLSAEATTYVLAQELGGEPSPALVAVVYDLTEGNPFYIQEMARTLLKDDRVEARDGQWHLTAGDQNLKMPAGLSGLLHERVARLGSEVETTLIAAAVIGREFSFGVLRGIVPLPDSNLIAALDAALATRLLDESEYGYRFRHPLIRRELYDSLSRVRRARLHSQTAEAIESIQSRQPGGVRDIEALAFHYDLSDRRDRALPYLIQAGQKAASVYAFEVAVDYFERALALMEALDTEAGTQRWMVLESLGWWHTILADTPQAVKRFEQAAALPPTDRWQSGKRDRARVHRGAVMALVTAGDITGTEAHLRAALAEVDEKEDAAEYAHVLYNVAQVHWHRGEYQEAFNAAQHSLNVAERLNDSTAIARAFEMLALACHSLGEWQDGLRFEAQRATLAGSGLDVTEAFDVHL
ncbi:MAG: AAA family ATPase [Chloroflexi bacterium]|nr:AAA family ATPase [Chloroflexota bacterium]